ncbi:uncharacterized protein LOC128556317 [Mercenaria mercenaria]|uniref:uncharacterized protein LOC128556317 n=1 Tax=Mercenaria mercenaria TaxID=6596 RepID=UPI00234E90BD|nr:uncharacterized protein LOC128556317 [Mercenaria mercenaria]
MAWHKQKQYDPTDAFIQNERHQKVLDLKLQKIDKLWYNQLRLLSRDRLQITSDLLRLEDEKGQLEYYDENMEVHKLKEYTDGCMLHMKQLKRELTHDNFNFETTGAIHMKRTIQSMNLPRLDGGCIVTQSHKHNKKQKKPEKSHLRKRRKSNLMKSKIFSISDSNLDKVSKYKQENNESDVSKSELTRVTEPKLGTEATQKTTFPNISSKLKVSRTNEQHRYLKERMATALVLPTVTEVPPRQRKLSI